MTHACDIYSTFHVILSVNKFVINYLLGMCVVKFDQQNFKKTCFKNKIFLTCSIVQKSEYVWTPFTVSESY